MPDVKSDPNATDERDAARKIEQAGIADETAAYTDARKVDDEDGTVDGEAPPS